MGASQSATGDASPTAGATKVCYYELLGVERQASETDIKKAYRRKALELHPDRNRDNIAESTRLFADLQTAYEVLSDPHERAWYDSHRDTILSGQDVDGAEPTTYRNVRLTSVEEIMTLIRKFNSSVPFDDEPTGFYGISRETFEHLALEEEAAADAEGSYCPDYPTFGSSDDDYENVVKPFYASWASFSTCKSFSWKDKYRLSDAPDRRVRRLMEKENKKLRDDAIRDFNETVRFLVTFVRKRDPRYVPNSQTDAERQASMRNAAAAQAARSRAANQERIASYEVPEWAQSTTKDADEGVFSESDADSVIEVLECVVCDKTFKSENQFEAHEKSKKHIKALQNLRRQMKKEGVDLDIDANETSTNGTSEQKSSGQDEDEQIAQTPADVHGDSSSDHREDKKPELVDDDEGHVDEAGKKTVKESSPSEHDASSDDEYAPRDAVVGRLVDEASTADHGNELSEAAQEMSIHDNAPKKKVGMARAKRERKAAQAQLNMHRCSVCEYSFDSRTKLFRHIQDEGHAALAPKQSKSGKSKRR